jgi:uncharacterized protein
MIVSLSLREARRIALAAQGFGNRRPEGPARRRALRSMIEALGVLQIDSVNVLARAHLLPAFARLGCYEPADLHHLAYAGRQRVLFEYWAHEASYLPIALHPFFRWRMRRAAAGRGIYRGLAEFGRNKRVLIERTLREIADRGALAAGEFSAGDKGSGGWWGWSETKHAVEWLFWAGEVTTATRRGTFERVYDLPGRVLPQAIVDAPTPDERDAIRHLVALSAQAQGVATEQDLRDYYRLDVADTKQAIAELVEAGVLMPAKVEGWDRPAFLAREAAQPARMTARALLAPFDPLIWHRDRTEALFGARIRLEIYTPAHKREHGYYVLPFLLGDRIVARLDLKADREGRRLLALASHLEPGAQARQVIGPLAQELRLMAQWLGLPAIAVAPRGDLASALAAALASPDTHTGSAPAAH